MGTLTESDERQVRLGQGRELVGSGLAAFDDGRAKAAVPYDVIAVRS